MSFKDQDEQEAAAFNEKLNEQAKQLSRQPIIYNESTPKTPHHWVPSPYGHGEWACTYCKSTNREIAVIGDPNHCPDAEKAKTPFMAELKAQQPPPHTGGHEP